MSHDRPLFVRYPQLEGVLPWRGLAELPTPVEPLAGLPHAWIKRDDLTHSVYGGNKVRKLEFVGAEMMSRGARRAYTFGATGTNAGVAAAMICRELGIALTVLTFDQPDSPTVRANQQLMRQLGARLVHCQTLLRTALAFYLHPARLSSDAYFLFAGCSNPVGLFGYVNAALELAEQVQRGVCPSPGTIVVPVGSNGTLAGLAVGLALAGLEVRLVGVRVANSHLGPIPTCTQAEVQKMVDGCVRFLKQHVPSLSELRVAAPALEERYFGDGYGVPTSAGVAAVARFAEWGIPLEATYTGKAAAAFLDLLPDASRPVLLWNTFNSRPTLALLAGDGGAAPALAAPDGSGLSADPRFRAEP